MRLQTEKRHLIRSIQKIIIKEGILTIRNSHSRTIIMIHNSNCKMIMSKVMLPLIKDLLSLKAAIIVPFRIRESLIRSNNNNIGTGKKIPSRTRSIRLIKNRTITGMMSQ